MVPNRIAMVEPQNDRKQQDNGRVAGALQDHWLEPPDLAAAARQFKDLDTNVREEADQGENQHHADFPPLLILEISIQSHSAILANGPG
jgi:hypothetical protein